jgi:hypothetical protein
MGQLPTITAEPARPFINCGLDYRGPLYIKLGSRRSKTTSKCYIALFICMATKAIHLELVNDLTTEAFLAAFTRFISHHSMCSNVHSDNGTTFVCANNELKKIYELLCSPTHQERRRDYATKDGINWHFIPPHGFYFGGLWEAGIKSVIYHLKRTTGTTLLTFEEMTTTLHR